MHAAQRPAGQTASGRPERKRRAASYVGAEPSVAEVEAEFWRIVETRTTCTRASTGRCALSDNRIGCLVLKLSAGPNDPRTEIGHEHVACCSSTFPQLQFSATALGTQSTVLRKWLNRAETLHRGLEFEHHRSTRLAFYVEK